MVTRPAALIVVFGLMLALVSCSSQSSNQENRLGPALTSPLGKALIGEWELIGENAPWAGTFGVEFFPAGTVSADSIGGEYQVLDATHVKIAISNHTTRVFECSITEDRLLDRNQYLLSFTGDGHTYEYRRLVKTKSDENILAPPLVLKAWIEALWIQHQASQAAAYMDCELIRSYPGVSGLQARIDNPPQGVQMDAVVSVEIDSEWSQYVDNDHWRGGVWMKYRDGQKAGASGSLSRINGLWLVTKS